MSGQEEVKHDWAVIAVDETGNCDAGWLEEFGVEQQVCFYLVDLSWATCCCEVTPSYWLRYVGFGYRPTKRAFELPTNTTFGELYGAQYALGCEADHYVHCSEVDNSPRVMRVNHLLSEDERDVDILSYAEDVDLQAIWCDIEHSKDFADWFDSLDWGHEDSPFGFYFGYLEEEA